MTLMRTEAPGAEPVTLAQAKAHLRVSHASEDELIADLVRAAREEVERQTGIAMLAQSWRLVLDDWPAGRLVRLQRYPVRAVQTITVFDEAGDPTVLAASAYRVDTLSRPGRVLVEKPLPVGSPLNGIEVDFTAGFGEAAADVPDTLKRAVLLLVAHWFEFRGAVAPDEQPMSYPAGFDRLLAPFRRRGL